MLHPKKYIADIAAMDFPFKARLMHFESRYRSIDQLLADLPVKNVLELSSGFSFRGLDLIKQKEVHYIDTDLPEIIDIKKNFINAFTAGGFEPRGKLQTLPLNALDEQQFDETVKLFEPGELAILTEGLLMYLNPEEKQKLFGIIRHILKERGGYWIVADIYVRRDIDQRHVMVTDNLQNFYREHKIEENKFDNFETAEKLFKDAGFVIDKVAAVDYSKGAGQNYFGNASAEQISILQNASQVRATWGLKLALGR
jgi:O-methyltransferase involved in polyketide biosynthesis